MYFYFNRKDSSIKLINCIYYVIRDNVKSFSLKSILSLSLILLFSLNVYFNNDSIYAYGHSLFGNNNGSGIQVQTNGNYKVELSTNPPKIPLNKNTEILLRVTSLANGSTGVAGAGGGGGGSEIMEIPAYLSLIKDGNINNLQHTLVMVRGGHYN